jgi:hypothetical protein
VDAEVQFQIAEKERFCILSTALLFQTISIEYMTVPNTLLCKVIRLMIAYDPNVELRANIISSQQTYVFLHEKPKPCREHYFRGFSV